MNFYFVDMHHSACDENALPMAVEEGFHDFEGACQRCYESPHQNPALEACNPIDCKDYDSITSNITYLSTPSNDCITSQCAAGDCQASWQTVIAYHDTCCDEDLPETIEESFHDFEEVCLFGCNVQAPEGYEVDCTLPKNMVM
mmetsp:Transcript_4674/g.8422  ORF Transcript_4674/g.8422 Transcript_4674/m.8422 type:complete len:143 (+) Transcript_4674:305-733(+)